MASKYIERNFNNIAPVITTEKLADRFLNMLYKVENMINRQTIYSTWIRFELGLSEPVVFNTSSTDPKQNLIQTLSISKTGAGVANSFTLTLKYDPFNYGQNPTDQIEQLDDIIAQALSKDLTDTTNESYFRGKLQYGYNYSDDADLVSPLYQFFLTSAGSSTDVESGIITYTFEGVSEIAPDSDFTTTYEAQTNVNLIQHVGEVLYKYYGDESNIPDFMKNSNKDTSVHTGSPKYYIDIPQKLIDESITISLEEKSGLTPLQYCQLILTNQISQTDTDSGNYNNLYAINDYQRPQYMIYLTDTDNSKTIHLEYIVPLDGSRNTSLSDYNFTWNQQSTNLVTAWKPEIDIRLYLLQKAKLNRSSEDLRNYFDQVETATADYYREASSGSSVTTLMEKYNIAKQAIETYRKNLQNITPSAKEYPTASLTLVGIPADAPIASEIKVTPIILQSVSRLAGYYCITECRDEISSNGIYTTTLTVFRLRGFTDSLDTQITDIDTQLDRSYEDRLEELILN